MFNYSAVSMHNVLLQVTTDSKKTILNMLNQYKVKFLNDETMTIIYE